MNDLSKLHEPVSDLFRSNPDSSPALGSDFLDAYHRDGFVAPVPMISADQLGVLRAELDQLSDPNQPFNPLWYEFHRNESTDDDTELFHALGAWRISKAFHDALWNPHFLLPLSLIHI